MGGNGDNILRISAAGVGLVWVLVPDMTYACAVCFGAADSPQTHGLNMAIMMLMGVTGSVLGAIVAFALRMRRRSRLISRYKGNGQFLSEKERRMLTK